MNTNHIIKECLGAARMVEGEWHLVIYIDHNHSTVDGNIERPHAPCIRFKKILKVDEK